MTGATTWLPAGFDERWVDAKGVRMRSLVGGKGPALVLVHGIGGAASNFAELAALLARRFRVLVPDLPGHGLSSPLPAAPNVDAFAERVRLAADAEGMLPAALVGHSLGGLVAMRLALRHPAAVRAVVLAGAAGIASSTRRAELWLNLLLPLGRPLARHRRALARRGVLRYLAFGYLGASDPPAMPAAGVAGLLAGAPLVSDLHSAARALVRDDPRIDLAGVRCPVFVLWGARDHQVPIDDAFEYARRLRAPLRTIADCGHLLVAERPDVCADAIADFLAAAAARSTALPLPTAGEERVAEAP